MSNPRGQHRATIAVPVRSLGRTVYLLEAVCDRCGRTNTHGGGESLDDIGSFLGHRASHCRCEGGYHLVDPLDVIGAFVAEQRPSRAAS